MKTAKKIMSVILTVMLVLSCVPMSVVSVSATESGVTIDLSTLTQDILFGDNHNYSLDGGVTYIPYEGAVTLTGKTEYSVILSEDANTSHDIILDNVTMTNQNRNGCILINMGDTLNLTVKGTNTLTQTGGYLGNSAPAIYLKTLSTLNITEESTGVLNTTGGTAFPAIGGRVYFSELNINGGTINAIAGSSAAAIGYSYNSYMSRPSYINIENAVVNAISSYNGAAIGGGEWTTECGTCYITIKNSVVNARSNEAAIGSGYEDYSIYNIKIEDSYVNAVGEEYASGIGTGSGNANAVVGDIEIINSIVYAIGGDKAAGIGGSNKTSAGNIKITNSTVTAIGGDMASGIGTGLDAVVLESDKITIDGSNIKSKLYDKIPIINSDGENVRLITIVLENAPATSVVTSVPGVKGYEDVNIQTLDSILYMYVPEGSNPDKVIANGKEYVGTVVDGSGTFVYEHDCNIEENGSCEKCGTIYQKAVDSNGDGYVEIGNKNQLNWFSRQVNSGDSSLNAILTDDIVVNEGTITAESANVTEWSPIGCYSSPYEGAFNGNNKTISGLYFNNEYADNIGIFGYIESDCSIKNLTLSNSYFCGNKNVGGIVGYNKESTVDNCFNSAEICGSEQVGGIVGYNYHSNVSNCTNNGKIFASKIAGGIVGYDSSGAVENCLNTGEILGIDYLGGVIGHELFGTVTACGNEGEITGLYTYSNYAVNYGGLAGSIKNANILDCYNKGNISSFSETYYKGQIGGIAGIGYNVNIKNCYNTGELFSTDLSESGGIFGFGSDSEITNCYNTAAIKGTVEISGGIVGGSSGNTIVNCYNSGACTGTVSTGGIIASTYSPSTVSNCYYLENCAVDSEGNSMFGIGDSASDESEVICAKTKKQFVSGEVAYLLQGEQKDHIWGQKIGTDEIPVLDGDKVYRTKNCIGEVAKYSNSIETTHSFNNTHVCKDCYALEENQIAGVAGYSLSLGGNIALSYHMVLDESVIADENAKLVFTVPNGDETKTVECFVKNATKNGDFYVFTCEVPAKEMASNITCKVVSGNSVSSTFTYSVKQYADIILANPDKYEKEIPLVKAMLNYGAYTQKYFGYNTANLANANLSDDDKALTDVDLSKYDYTVTGNQEGVKLYGATLSLNSETAINLYFKISDEIDVEALDITVDGKPVQIENIGEYSIINIPNIPAQNLGDMYEVKIGNLTVNYGVFSYGDTAMSTDKEILKNTIKALYAYNQAAVEYTK